MAITYLAISYPNFILGAIIDPYEVNINNSEITDKVNYVIDDINKATLDISALTLNKADKTYVNSEISRIDTKFTTSIASNVSTLNATIASNVNTLNSTISNVNSTLDGKITNLAGTGRTTQTVKGNADALIAHKISSDHDARYTTKTELTGGALDGRYYTKTLLDGGQLDNRYFTESELSSSSGASIIGNTSFDGSPITVQQSLEWLKSQIDGVAIGAIPDGSVMDIKLSGEPTQILGRVNSHIATTNAHISTTNAHIATTNAHISTANAHISNTNVHVTSAEKTSIGTIGSKVDKVTGKGLSTNDYTTAEKTKLAGLPAEVVNAIAASGNADPNTTTVSYVVSNHTNTPDSASYWHIQTMFYAIRTGNRAQIAVRYNGTTDEMYIRSYYTNAWTTWKRVYHSANLTKATLNLGNIQNYPIATTAQAEAGTIDTAYMTPLKTAQLIAKKMLENRFQQYIYELGTMYLPMENGYILGAGQVNYGTTYIQLRATGTGGMSAGVTTSSTIDLTPWSVIRVKAHRSSGNSSGKYFIVVSSSKDSAPNNATGRIASLEVDVTTLLDNQLGDTSLNITGVTGSYYVRVHYSGGTGSTQHVIVGEIELLK